jgi:anti-anti-sigma factor
MTLELHATPQEVMRAVETFQEFATAQGLPEKTIFDLALALEESASNIVNHALQRDARKTFRVALLRADNAIVVELRDPGPAFDPTAAPDRKPKPEDDDLPGGWGIQLVRRHTDEIRYAREVGENVLRLVKRLGQTRQSSGNQFADKDQTKQTKTKTDMPLEIQIQKSIGGQTPGAVTVKLTGSLDTATAPDLERQLAPVLANPIKDLVFDLAQLKFITSAGLRVFATARKQLKERGGQASFVQLQPQIQEVFEIMKSLPGVAVFKDVAEMDRYLAARQRSHMEDQ